MLPSKLSCHTVTLTRTRLEIQANVLAIRLGVRPVPAVVATDAASVPVALLGPSTILPRPGLVTGLPSADGTVLLATIEVRRGPVRVADVPVGRTTRIHAQTASKEVAARRGTGAEGAVVAVAETAGAVETYAVVPRLVEGALAETIPATSGAVPTDETMVAILAASPVPRRLPRPTRQAMALIDSSSNYVTDLTDTSTSSEQDDSRDGHVCGRRRRRRRG